MAENPQETTPVESAQAFIRRLGLVPHPEGGWYRETFRSAPRSPAFPGASPRAACTSIYYLLEGDDYSGFHRLDADEIWYFHAGAPLSLHVIGPEGGIETFELSDRSTGSLSLAVPAGRWFAAEIPGKKGFTLSSCAVAPGFSFDTFEMGVKESMLRQFPALTEMIRRLCR